jgi:hypothetical protein
VLELQAKIASGEAEKEQTVSDDKETAGDDVIEKTEDAVPEASDAMEEVTPVMAADTPLKQMMFGVDPHEIQCKDGQVLVFKASNWRPSCVNESSFDVLSARGWVTSHDPTHEDLAKMQDDYMAKHASEEETKDKSQIEIEEEVSMEDKTSNNGTDTKTEGEMEPQSYTIELREDMSMSSQ